MGEQRVALVTGGAAGIGRACVRRFAADGWAVGILDNDPQAGRLALRELNDAGADALLSVGEVASEEDVRGFAALATERWGRIDALVANAGARVFGSLLEATEADWELILGVNLKGVAYSCKHVLPAMLDGGGAIVIISSANALVGRASMPLYDATKAAVLSLTRSLAVEYGPRGVRVNAVCPGFTVTDYHTRRGGTTAEELFERSAGYGLLGAPAAPSEIASAVCFLCGPDSAKITGQTLLVDSGLSVTSGAAR